MHPTLTQLDLGGDFGAFSVSSYPALVALGFALAIALLCRGGGRQGLPSEILLDMGLYMVVFGILGARLLHVFADGQLWNYVHWCTQPDLVAWKITPEHCRALEVETIWDEGARLCRPVNGGAEPLLYRCTLWLQFWQGGLAFYGGFVLATAFAVYFIRREGLPLRQVLDLAGWALPFGLAWGRMGCFLGGCCFGRLSGDSWAAVPFPRWSPAWQDQVEAGLLTATAGPSLPVHPTQLYEAGAALAIGAAAYLMVRRKTFHGQAFLVSCLLYGGARFTVEFWRADERGEWWGGSTSQWIGLAVVVASLRAWRRWRRTAATGDARPGIEALDVAHRR